MPNSAIRLHAAFWLAIFLFTSREAQAVNCRPASGQSPCVPAGALWARAGSEQYFSLPSAGLVSPGEFVASWAGEYLYAPLKLNVDSPDPNGRDIHLIKQRAISNLGARIGVARSVELALQLPIAVYQSGSGIQAIESRAPAELSSQSLLDPRLEARHRLVQSRRFALDTGALLALPLGNQSAHAGERGLVFAPEFLGHFRSDQVDLSAQLGVRLRPPVELGGVEYGSQLNLGLGVELKFLEPWLYLGAEVFLLSALQTSEITPGRQVLDRPAEWFLQLATEPIEHLRIGLGGGSALPLSRAEEAGKTSFHAGLGAPAFHAALRVQYRTDIFAHAASLE